MNNHIVSKTKWTSFLLFLQDLMIVLIVVVTVITLAIITVILVLSVKRYRRYKSEIHRPDGLFKVRTALISIKRKIIKRTKVSVAELKGNEKSAMNTFFDAFCHSA